MRVDQLLYDCYILVMNLQKLPFLFVRVQWLWSARKQLQMNRYVVQTSQKRALLLWDSRITVLVRFEWRKMDLIVACIMAESLG